MGPVADAPRVVEMLVHDDASRHAWLPSGQQDLVSVSDDATNEVYYLALAGAAVLHRGCSIIGGFAARTLEHLYRGWMPFGMLSSHSRCHGMPPKDPREYDAAFIDGFRRTVESEYKVMPARGALEVSVLGNRELMKRLVSFERNPPLRRR